MKVAIGVVAVVVLGGGIAQARPMLVAGVSAGVDVETGPVRGLEAFAFEGEAMGELFGLVVRGLGANGSSDYMYTGFDRLNFALAASYRPFGRQGGPGYGALVLRRLAIEAGLAYQHAEAGFDSSDNVGLHVAAHLDLPLSRSESGPMIRLVVQRPFLLTDAKLVVGPNTQPRDTGDPAVQQLVGLAVAF
jgi:hypothetical protein